MSSFGGGAAAEDDDEALARRLQEEEDAAGEAPRSKSKDRSKSKVTFGDILLTLQFEHARPWYTKYVMVLKMFCSSDKDSLGFEFLPLKSTYLSPAPPLPWL